MINIICPSRYKIDRKKIKNFIAEALTKKNIIFEYDLNIVFVGRTKMKYLVQKYKQEKFVLPVISFSYNEKQEERIFLGEIFICYPQLILLAAERNKKVDEVINQLINHGLENILK